MASKLLLVVVFVFDLIALAPAVAAEQRRTKPQCHENESLALLQFKESLRINCFASEDPSAYPKASMWESKRSDCCKWHGVKCDKDTGHVVSLNLNSSCLLGPINSNSSLFQLFHIQKLNLADNWFNGSQIPTSFRQLSRLTNLNLSNSIFSGQITTEIMELSNLVLLDLSRNDLELPKLGLQSMAKNLTNLKELNLGQVNMSSSILKTLTNVSFLTSLSLQSCGLYGEFPFGIFHLPNFQHLDVSNNFDLNGTIPEFNKSSPLKSLELSFTSFFGQVNMSSSILKTLTNLSSLTSLSLQSCGLYGEFPFGIFHLPNLQHLDVSNNFDLNGTIPEFNKSSPLKSLELSFTSFFGQVNMSSSILKTLTNLSSLTSLSLQSCGLYGEFPFGIFHLPNLQHLDVSNNFDLNGTIPEFNKSSPLKSLKLSFTSFSGKLHYSISNLKSLQHLGVVECNFFGQIPAFLGNLSKLVSLEISGNRFHGEFPVGIFHLPNLRMLEVWFNANLTLSSSKFNKSSPLELLYILDMPFSSKLQHSIGNLKALSSLIAIGCNFFGPISASLFNLTQLTSLRLEENNLYGSIPESISKLVNLELLNLYLNGLSGIVEFNLFLKLKKLFFINLSYNNISLLTKPSTNATFPKFQTLVLSYCHLSEFPDFLRNQDQLVELDLSQNKIHGQVPKWIWDTTKHTLWSLDLSFNFLTSFDEFPTFSSLSRLEILRLDSNKLKGPLPTPPHFINLYSATNNKLTGDIHHWICNLSFITVLDLSSNNLSGSLPKCLGNMTPYLTVLNLNGNRFHGTIPQSFVKGNILTMIDLSQNELQGPMPRTLANCTHLEVLNLGDNQIKDSFPFWLGGLSELKVLILRSNEFYGSMRNPNTHFDFPSLRVIDLSNNNITGKLPSQHFQTWKAMRILNETSLTYMQTYTRGGYYNYSMTLINKGEKMEYARILDFFMAIDLSNNRFEGEIPEALGYLKGLKLLNLSNNFLIGHIPSSLGNLMDLESLDLSQNKLSGSIPSQLVQLNFLAFFSVSHNHLTGLIPSGNQFNTFPNTSFSDNLELCGSPLSIKCENFEHSHSPTLTIGDNQSWRSLFEFKGKVVVTGYGCGFILGLVVGITKKHDWFMKTFVIC